MLVTPPDRLTRVASEEFSKEPVRRSDWRPYVMVAVCSILYSLPFLHVLSHQGDEGTLTAAAVRVLDGQVPYRDFFEVMGPGTFYWLALFFKLLGTTWVASRICLLVTTLGITVLLLYLARGLPRPTQGREWIAAPVVFFVAVSYRYWNTVSHHMDSTLTGLWAFAAFMAWIKHRNPLILFGAGAGAGLTSLVMLPKGGLLCAAFLFLLPLLNGREFILRRAVTLLGGYASIIGLTLALFWRAGGLTDLIQATLLWPLRNYNAINNVSYGLGFHEMYRDVFVPSFSAFGPPAVAIFLGVLFSIPFAMALALPGILLVLSLCNRRAAFDRLTWPYWIAGAALWLSEMHRKDLIHIVFGSPLFILLAFYLFHQTRGKWSFSAMQVATACSFALALLNPLVAMIAPYRIDTPRGGIRGHSADAVLPFLLQRTQAGENIFVYPYAPQYYFLSGGTNPTRYSILLYGYNTEQQFRDAVKSLEAHKPRYVVWDHAPRLWAHQSSSYRPPTQDELIMEPYLLQHYRAVGGDENGYQFLERKDAALTLLDPRKANP